MAQSIEQARQEVQSALTSTLAWAIRLNGGRSRRSSRGDGR